MTYLHNLETRTRFRLVIREADKLWTKDNIEGAEVIATIWKYLPRYLREIE